MRFTLDNEVELSTMDKKVPLEFFHEGLNDCFRIWVDFDDVDHFHVARMLNLLQDSLRGEWDLRECD